MAGPDLNDTETAGLRPDWTCRSGLMRWQWGFVILVCAAGPALFLASPQYGHGVLLAALSVFFAAAILIRLLLLLVGFWILRRRRPADQMIRVPGAVLPVYSVLVALYREAPLIRQLLRGLRGLDWPQDRLDVQLLVEVDDFETRLEIERAGLPRGVRMTLVPRGGPRTKPNALNFGLKKARGALICCFDAEDRPHPGQLREAHARFADGPAQLAVLQAPLIGTGRNQDWLAQQWALEYAVSFCLIVPAMTALRIPLALGGTSNHFRINALRTLGGWDAWNVTEDADIGLRFARAGYAAGALRLPTWEAAPTRYDVWLNQRARWIKGFMLTYGVLMRAPSRLVRELGLWRFLSLQLTFGASMLTHFVYAPALCIASVSLWTAHDGLGQIGSGVLMAGLGVGAIADMLAPGRWTSGRIVAMLTRPAYWPLHSVAAYLALIELVRRPFHWAKTPHQPEPLEETLTACSTGSSAVPSRSSSRSSVLSHTERPGQ